MVVVEVVGVVGVRGGDGGGLAVKGAGLHGANQGYD